MHSICNVMHACKCERVLFKTHDSETLSILSPLRALSEYDYYFVAFLFSPLVNASGT